MRMRAICAAVLALVLLAGCGATETIHSHEYKEETMTLSCTQDAGTRYTCECGHSYMNVEIKAAGHQYESVLVNQKGDIPAYTQHTCSVCGDVYQTDFRGGDLPEETEPVETEPAETESKETEPKETEPKQTEPKETEPAATEPKQTDPPQTQPSEQPNTDSGDVMHFFDDAAFVGDSVSLKLQRYQASTGVFGNATFLTAGSYSVFHAVNDSMFISYRGQQMTPEDALAACGAKKVFILLGMNDIGRSDVGIDKTIANWGVFVQRIREKNPDITIYIQSGTPIHSSRDSGLLSNVNMDKYNEKLKAFAAQNGCQFIDIATAMKDANGDLKNEYCSDQYVHLSDAGCVAWISVLRNHFGG